MSIRQTTFDLTAPPEPRVVVADLRALCADGAEWDARAEALFRSIAADVGSVLPSHFRARVLSSGLGEPPHGSGAYGRLYARMVQRHKWRAVFAGTTSTAPSRNAARDVWRYAPPEPA